jgi:hypothetical protein
MVAALPKDVRFAMSVHEPATLLTDYLLAALAGWLAWRLRGPTPVANQAVCWWRRTLGLTALSALVGGSYHGFAPNFPAPVAGVWWITTLLIICLLSAAMAMSLVHELVPPARQRPWIGVIAFKLAAFGGAAITHPVFVVAIFDYGLTMLTWGTVALIVRRSWSGWMLAAIALSVVAALVQQMRWAPSLHFNHNDLYHVIQALALVCFYAAGAKFSGPAPSITPAGP